MTPAQVDQEKPSRLGAPALLSVLAGTMKEAAALGGLHGWVTIDAFGGVVTTTPRPSAWAEPNGDKPEPEPEPEPEPDIPPDPGPHRNGRPYPS